MAGYLRPPDGDTVVFAELMSQPAGATPNELNALAAEAQGEIATAVHESLSPEVPTAVRRRPPATP